MARSAWVCAAVFAQGVWGIDEAQGDRHYMSPLLAIFGIGTTELMILAVIMLLLFGNRLPGLMRSLGRGVVEFKRGVQGIDEEGESETPNREPRRSEEAEETAKSPPRGD